MIKVLIVAVNYNSYKELDSYLKTIEEAASGVGKAVVDVTIADNSSNYIEIEASKYKHIGVRQVKFDNIGYLGAAQEIINKSYNDYDYVAISNVDLKIGNSFFQELCGIKQDDTIAWIAPCIYSHDENRDRNPKVLERYSKKKLQLIYYMYKFPILFYLYTATAYKRKKLTPHYDEMDIYAGHGSFILLTRSFFRKYDKIEYPIFLFGEELYLAELVRKEGMRVSYMPNLKVEDNEHVSTSKMKKKFYFKCNTESIKYILETFYE